LTGDDPATRDYDDLSAEMLTQGGYNVPDDASELDLLRAEETVNGNASLVLIELASGARFSSPAREHEACGFLLSGRGTVAFSRSGSGSRSIIDPDTAIWVGAGTDHTLMNTGEGPFRYLEARCRIEAPGSGGLQILPRSSWPVHELVGFTSRTILSRADLDGLGASRTIGVDLETLAPLATLGTHAHEEEVMYMLRGDGFVRTALGDTPVRPGSVVYTGPRVPHSVHNMDDDIFQYLVWEFRP
jgi:mannose-6-phosphate isomerase-like protein (cupin superfamily)